jgi:hypothetical protein
MGSNWKRAAAFVIALAGCILAAGLLWSCRKSPITLRGAVLVRNSDPRKESPIPDVEVTASMGTISTATRTAASGYFSLQLRRWARGGQPVTLKFRHAGYLPMDLEETVSDEIYIVRMVPIATKAEPEPNQPATAIANVMIRYSMKTTAAVSVGSAVKTFEVPNTGNLPCHKGAPCSPDGKWKASVTSTELDAGEGNEFRNVRLSCIAGPCPFTKVDVDGYSDGGNKIHVGIRNWSDTTTFLLEAEVYHPMESDVVRESHPAIFGRTLNFSVPATAQGPSIEADVNGDPVVFPLGPSLCLSWADCAVTADKDQNKTYRCALKGNYQFH